MGRWGGYVLRITCYSSGYPLRFTHYDWLKLRQRHLFSNIIEHHFHWHADFHVCVVDANEIRQQSGTFIEFDFGNVVGNLIFNRRKVGLVKHNPGIYFPPATELLPSKTARPAVWTERSRWIPQFVTIVATLQFHLTSFESIPIRRVQR